MEQTVLSDYRLRLDDLIQEGRALSARLQTEPTSPTTTSAIRSWQQASATMINELSGSSKSHWLARAFSGALLVRSNAGEAVQNAPLAEIVDRIVGVLERASQSLTSMVDRTAAPSTAPSPHRFDFVHNETLRPVLEQTYEHSRRAFDEGRLAESLVGCCGVLEAILTDALEYIGRDPREWSLQMRIAAAEQAGLIGRGCARLPSIALSYRDLLGVEGHVRGDVTVSAREARTIRQVLHVVMRDLNPGR